MSSQYPSGAWGGLAPSAAGTAGPRPSAAGFSLDEAWLRVAGQRGTVALRPMTAVELLDAAFASIRTSPAAMLGTAGVLAAVHALALSTPLWWARLSDAAPDRSEPGFGEELLALTIWIGTWAVAAVAVCVLLAPLALAAALGRDGAGAWRGASPRRWLSFVGVTLLLPLVSLVGLLPVAAGAALLAAGADVAGGLLVGLGAAAWVLGWQPLVLRRWSLAPVAVGAEGRGAWAALRRSWHLTRGGSWRVLGAQVAAWVVSLVAFPVLTGPTGIVAELITGEGDSAARTVTAEALLVVGDVAAGSVLLAFLACVTALVHLDVRIRREGLAVRLLHDLWRGRAEHP